MQMEGGKRRIDRVLSPTFVENLSDLALPELRRRRDEALAEREYLSLVRRLVQGRLDILGAETSGRGRGESGSLVDRLSEVLADERHGTSRGAVLPTGMPEQEVAQARRRIERLVSDATLSNPGSLSDQELADTEARLLEEERTVSQARAAVIAVHDALQGELKRRYKEDFSKTSTS